MSVAARPWASDQVERDMAASVDLDAWYRRYGESVFRRCLRLTGERAQASDLLQEVFLRAHRFQNSYRGEASPLTWLYTITSRCFVDTLRKKPRVDPEELAVFLREEQEGLEVTCARQALVGRLLARVPADVRDIVVHRYFDELEHSEIALRLGINEKTVRRKLERFLRSARKILEWGR